MNDTIACERCKAPMANTIEHEFCAWSATAPEIYRTYSSYSNPAKPHNLASLATKVPRSKRYSNKVVILGVGKKVHHRKHGAWA